MYCFYNNVDHYTAGMHWNCSVQLTPDVPQLGCTLVPLDVVRPVHDGRGPKGFRSIHGNPGGFTLEMLVSPCL